MALNDRQQRFCEEYVVDLNATQAARRAGYTATSAHTTGSDLLKYPEVDAEIKRLMAERAQRTQITADQVVRELALLAFSDLGNYVVFSESGVQFRSAEEIPVESRRALASVKIRQRAGGTLVEIKPWNKVAALQLLAQHLGILGNNTPPPPPVDTDIDLSQLTDEELEEYGQLRAKARRSSGGD